MFAITLFCSYVLSTLRLLSATFSVLLVAYVPIMIIGINFVDSISIFLAIGVALFFSFVLVFLCLVSNVFFGIKPHEMQGLKIPIDDVDNHFLKHSINRIMFGLREKDIKFFVRNNKDIFIESSRRGKKIEISISMGMLDRLNQISANGSEIITVVSFFIGREIMRSYSFSNLPKDIYLISNKIALRIIPYAKKVFLFIFFPFLIIPIARKFFILIANSYVNMYTLVDKILVLRLSDFLFSIVRNKFNRSARHEIELSKMIGKDESSLSMLVAGCDIKELDIDLGNRKVSNIVNDIQSAQKSSEIVKDNNVTSIYLISISYFILFLSLFIASNAWLFPIILIDIMKGVSLYISGKVMLIKKIGSFFH